LRRLDFPSIPDINLSRIARKARPPRVSVQRVWRTKSSVFRPESPVGRPPLSQLVRRP
jgi:hypothetical protein